MRILETQALALEIHRHEMNYVLGRSMKNSTVKDRWQGQNRDARMSECKRRAENHDQLMMWLSWTMVYHLALDRARRAPRHRRSNTDTAST